MALLIASDLHKDIAGRPLLRGVSLKLERRDRMTIAGRNGAGKTTLLRMLAGQTSIDRGELIVAKGVRVALHDQRPPRERALPLREYLLSGCSEELQIESELRELEERMAGGEAEDATLARYAQAQSRLEARGGYLWRDRATVMARGLGFAGGDLDRPLDSFSGGQLTRASLARALATGADVLLLDEPTNHLDIDSLEWLEQTLVELDAAVVLVAHDRWFLEAVGTSVLELYGAPPTRSRFFAGSWHAWRREQAAREIALGRAIDAQRAEIERMERFIERFRYKASKARQAQSRVKRLANVQRIERDPRDSKSLEFAFSAPQRSGRVIFELLGGRIEVGGEDGAQAAITLLEQAELWLERGEHVSLVGANGSGKTTLIETLAGRRELAAGSLSVGHNVKVGYLSQHAEELGDGGPPEQTVLAAAQRATGLTPGQGPRAARPLPVLRRGRREAAQRPFGRRAPAPVPGRPRGRGPRSQRPDPRRADEPPRHREPRGPRGRPARVPRGRAPGLSRPRATRRRRQPHDCGRGRITAQLPRRVARVRAGTRSAPRRRRGRSRYRLAACAGGARPCRGRGQRRAADRRRGAARGACEAGAEARGCRAKAKKPSKNRLSAQEQAEQAVEEAEAEMRALEEELSQPAAWATRYESAKSEARHTAARRAVEDAYARLEALID